MASEMRHTIGAKVWTGLALPPLAWFVAQQLSFSFASICVQRSPALVLGIHGAAAVLAGLGILLCWQGSRGTDTHGGRAERHFLCGLGALLGGILLLAILAQGAAALFFAGCER
jgi:hypothetical protein